MKTVAICQARMGSTRLPGKVLLPLGMYEEKNARPTLDWVVSAAERANGVDEVIVATSTLAGDDRIAEWARDRKVRLFRGSETDVLSRFLGAVTEANADIVVRLTGDCPFLDHNVIGEVIQLRKMKDVAYATNTDPPTYPDGLDVEVFTRDALESAHREAVRGTDRDTVTRWMVRNRHRFPAANLVCPLPHLDRERWVLDSPQDHTFITGIAHRLGEQGITAPTYLDILAILDKEPWLRECIEGLTRNERFYAGLSSETGVGRSYAISKACLAEAEHLIPLGAQTFSKSKLQFPEGAAPLFMTHGDGGYCFDVDGNDYVDLCSALLPNILGYRDPDVDGAIREQLNRGISFSLASSLENDLAERLNFHIPSAEMVRFGKNGSDVTTAAVRLARHITKRDKIIVGGYHGWHDWSMAVSDRTNGIPGKVTSLSFSKAHIGGTLSSVAAVIIEPEFFDKAELAKIKQWCDDYAIILIFDEIISGFRCGMGGLQKALGITPDLSTFGKAMANGMPISALVGLEKYMKRIPEIAFSGTFFGETLSIAASIATLDKLNNFSVPQYLKKIGEQLRFDITALIHEHNLFDSISIHSPVELNRISFKDKAIQSLFIQEMAKNGVLIIGSHNTCFAHKKPELDRIITAWEATLKAIAGGAKLEGEVIKGKAVR